jgi:uncharacterized protein YecE (DUF72 family)
MGATQREFSIGIGGWEHAVLDDCFYSLGALDSAEKLRSYAQYFRTVEVRPTFWDDTLGGADARNWVQAVSEERTFLFQVKLHSSFTHQKQIRPQVARNTRTILDTFARAHRLGALVLQFPYAFTNISAHRAHLLRVAATFKDFPCFVEFRHASWNFKGLDDFARQAGVRLIQVDLPRLRQLMPFGTPGPGDTAYIRLHGRNERGWMLNGMDTRYDYLYNAREINEITRRIEALPPRYTRVFVLCNNTTNGKAAANAFQLGSALHARKVVIPPPALLTFPQLSEVAACDPGQPLFSGDRYKRAI